MSQMLTVMSTGRHRKAASLKGRAFWSLADQALSSLTNAGLAIVVARSVGELSFGAFSLALVTFSFTIGIMRAVISDVYVIQFSGVDGPERRQAARQATGGALAFGALAGVVCAVAGVIVPNAQTGRVLVALAIVLPGLMVQDCFRFVFFAAGQPALSTFNDLIWAVIQFSAIGLLLSSGHPSIVMITLAWGLAALVAAMVAAVQSGLMPAPFEAWPWIRANRALNVRLGLDYVLNMGAVNLATYAIGAIVGLIAVGALRAAQVLLGPLQLLFSGAAAFILPVLSARAGTGASLFKPALAASVAMATLAGAWVGILVLMPPAWGAEILGASWTGAHSVMLASGLVFVIISITLGPSLALRALRRADVLLRVTAVQSPLILALGAGGAYLHGALGAAEGFAVAQAAGALVIWVLFLRADDLPRDFVPVIELPSDLRGRAHV